MFQLKKGSIESSLPYHIPQPCHENWENMTPQTTGRFCNSCNQPVVDFSKMSDHEIKSFFLKVTNNNLCGQFNESQLNQGFTNDSTFQKKGLGLFWNSFKTTLVLGFLILIAGCRRADHMLTGNAVIKSPSVNSSQKNIKTNQISNGRDGKRLKGKVARKE